MVRAKGAITALLAVKSTFHGVVDKLHNHFNGALPFGWYTGIGFFRHSTEGEQENKSHKDRPA